MKVVSLDHPNNASNAWHFCRHGIYKIMIDLRQTHWTEKFPYDASDVRQAGIDALQILADTAKDLAPCGPPVVQALERVVLSMQRNAKRLESNSSQTALRTASIQSRCEMLKENANEMIATYPYSDVPTHWRQLYMDASLLYVAAALMDFTGEKCAFTLSGGMALVRVLDMANIVTAFFDKGRGDALRLMMNTLQHEMRYTEGDPGEDDFDESGESDHGRSRTKYIDDEHKNKKRKMDKGKGKASDVEGQEIHTDDDDDERQTPLLPGIRQIKRYTVDTAPDMGEIDNETEPFIVSGAILEWPAIDWDHSCWRSTSYLRKVAGMGRIVPVEVGSSYTSEGWTQKMMRFEEFLYNIRWRAGGRHEKQNPKPTKGHRGTKDSPPTLYLAQHDLFQQFPELLRDIITPDYCFAAPGAPALYPDYRPPASEAGYITNAWMGPKGTYSPAHTDPYYNCYAQVVGSKHIWIAPPECSNVMETLHDRSTQDGADADEQEDGHNSADSRSAAAQQYMGNTSNADVFALSRSADTAEAGSPPSNDFVKAVLPKAQQAILEEGDLLFMPPK